MSALRQESTAGQPFQFSEDIEAWSPFCLASLSALESVSVAVRWIRLLPLMFISPVNWWNWYHLIINAVQASNSSQKVTVTLGRDHDEVWFEVADEGVGIPSSVLPSIFDPFFSTKSEQGRSGMGLGLSVSRSLVESMNGRIDVQSEEGKGSRFRVVLPTNKL